MVMLIDSRFGQNKWTFWMAKGRYEQRESIVPRHLGTTDPPDLNTAEYMSYSIAHTTWCLGTNANDNQPFCR